MRADFVDMTIKQGKVISIVTDDDESLVVPTSLTYSAEKDTMVRRLLYYNKDGNNTPIQVIGQQAVSIITPIDKARIKERSTDPLTLTAAWLSANRQWLNMTIGIKCGSSEDDAKQTIVLSCDSVSSNGNGAMWLTLLHNQGDMPQYYTQEYNISIPITDMPDTIHLSVNTYSGAITRQMIK